MTKSGGAGNLEKGSKDKVSGTVEQTREENADSPTGFCCPKCNSPKVEKELPAGRVFVALAVGALAFYITGGPRWFSNGLTQGALLSLALSALCFGIIMFVGEKAGRNFVCTSCGVKFSKSESMRSAAIKGEPYALNREANKLLGFAIAGFFLAWLCFIIQPFVIIKVAALEKKVRRLGIRYGVKRLKAAKLIAIVSLVIWGLFVIWVIIGVLQA